MRIYLTVFTLFFATLSSVFAVEKFDFVQVLPGGIAEELISPSLKTEIAKKKEELKESEGEVVQSSPTPEIQEGISLSKDEIVEEHPTSEVQKDIAVTELDSPSLGKDSSSKTASFSEVEKEGYSEIYFDSDPYFDPQKKWYFEFKPGYFYFTDNNMRRFFNDGGFAFRGETGCRVYEYMIVWVDGGYFEKKGSAIGGSEALNIKLANITLGLKGIYYFNERAAIYAGAGPRLFMMLLKNATPFVRGDDNEIGIGGGFNAGFWFFPVTKWENFFIDIFADYSLKTLKVDADEISSFNYDVNISGLTGGIGIGVRF